MLWAKLGLNFALPRWPTKKEKKHNFALRIDQKAKKEEEKNNFEISNKELETLYEYRKRKSFKYWNIMQSYLHVIWGI